MTAGVTTRHITAKRTFYARLPYMHTHKPTPSSTNFTLQTLTVMELADSLLGMRGQRYGKGYGWGRGKG